MSKEEKLVELNGRIGRCRKCGLWRGTVVPGEGPCDARVMLVGQNPGEKEDQAGLPFVGMAGKYLDRVLEKSGIGREGLFITSVVKHKTPGNRRPGRDSMC